MARYSQRTQASAFLADWGPITTPLNIAGGQETVSTGGYKYVVFTSSGTLITSGKGTLSYCAIGGGGSGGYAQAGGGGGGEVDTFDSNPILSNGTIVTVTIGAGGVGTTNDVTNTSGGTTTIVFGAVNVMTSLGGGAGRSAGDAGGSGGGGVSAAGAASGSNTNVGGTANSINYTSGGGGGATAVGANGTSLKAGNGGAGYTMTNIDAALTAANFPTSFAGMTLLSSGGGGGAYNFLDRGTGGTGAGQGGNGVNGGGTAGTSFGSGGGAGGRNGASPYTGNIGLNGKQGVVVFRIPT